MRSAILPQQHLHSYGQPQIETIDERRVARLLRKVFWSTVIVRFVVWNLIYVASFSQAIYRISGDLGDYQMKGSAIAESYLSGEINWEMWLDEGWFQVCGLFFALFGYGALWGVVLVSTLLCGLTSVLIYRVGRVAFGRHEIGAAAAFTFAYHPGAIFFQSLPLKEGVAVFGIMSITWGLVLFNTRRDPRCWMWLIIGFAVVAGIRIYLVPIGLYAAILCIAPTPTKSATSYVATVSVYLIVLVIIGVNALQAFDIDISKYEMLQYFDIERLNRTRTALVRGDAAMYETADDAAFSDDWLHNGQLIVQGCFFFYIGVDLTDLRSGRQYAAAPEGILAILCIPLLIRGLRVSMKRGFKVRLPIVIFFIALMFVYGGATTNLGALYRWRLQALPLGLLLIYAGAFDSRKGFINRFVRSWKAPSVPVTGNQPAVARAR